MASILIKEDGTKEEVKAAVDEAVKEYLKSYSGDLHHVPTRSTVAISRFHLLVAQSGLLDQKSRLIFNIIVIKIPQKEAFD